VIYDLLENIAQECWLMPIIPDTQEAEIGGLGFETSPGQKVSKIPSQTTSQSLYHMSITPAM
jgi:hypothetical protein